MALSGPDAPPAAPVLSLTWSERARALARFTRRHTVLATTCQVVGIYVIAGGSLRVGLPVVALVWLGSQAANLYVVGLNQLFDAPIDRINKPELPIASGELTRREGIALVAAAGMAALLLGAAQSFPLFVTLALVMLLGTLYSIPPWRLKGQPAAAATCIALARGVIANLGLYLHYRAVLPAVTVAAPPGWALGFFFGFGLVIALFKDIPDHDGDREYAVRTAAVRWGRRRTFALGRALLTALYLLALGAALLTPTAAGLAAIGHIMALALFWALSVRTDPADPRSMMRLYLSLWGLFYAEYVLLAAQALINRG